MKKLRIIIFSFISILIIGIVVTSTLINTNLESGVHKIELENEDSKSVEVSIESSIDTLSFSKESSSSISEIDKDYVKSIFSFIGANVSLESGLYKLTF
ncbi:MAG: hypothetical protein KAG37_11665 [Flavobacteriales bacterium]|nr:hypothetical protein [Flavobacteriales bacterium]